MRLPEVSLPIIHIEEPPLTFNFEQNTAHPKDGLFLYGPHQKAKKTRVIRVGVIGTPAGIGYFKTWAERLIRRIDVPPPGKRDKKNRLHLANFPGIEEIFGITFEPDGLVRLCCRVKRDRARHRNAKPS
jgi:hypothetical protein